MNLTELKQEATAKSSVEGEYWTMAIDPKTLLKLIAVVEAAKAHCASGNMVEGFVFTKDDQTTYETLDQALMEVEDADT